MGLVTTDGLGNDIRLPKDVRVYLISSTQHGPSDTERLASGDPRKSLQERYRAHADYVREMRQAMREMVHDRLILREDGDAIAKAMSADVAAKFEGL